ncbi:MAG: hypothetical protein ACI4MQ_04135 [Candidatus Coproplasma sp.]
MKKNFKRLVAILLSLAPLAFAAACSQPDNSASGGDPSDIVEEQPEDKPSEENPSEENPPEEQTPSEDEPSEETPSEEEPAKPTLPGGLVDGGNFTGNV